MDEYWGAHSRSKSNISPVLTEYHTSSVPIDVIPTCSESDMPVNLFNLLRNVSSSAVDEGVKSSIPEVRHIRFAVIQSTLKRLMKSSFLCVESISNGHKEWIVDR